MDQNMFDTETLDEELILESVQSGSDVRSTEVFFTDDIITGSDDLYASTAVTSDYSDLLAQIKVTNGLLGVSIALQIFNFSLFIMVFFIKIIKNNVTKYID